MNKPKAGDTFTCGQCGMSIEVKKPCECKDHGPKFECCGKPMNAD